MMLCFPEFCASRAILHQDSYIIKIFEIFSPSNFRAPAVQVVKINQPRIEGQQPLTDCNKTYKIIIFGQHATKTDRNISSKHMTHLDMAENQLIYTSSKIGEKL